VQGSCHTSAVKVGGDSQWQVALTQQNNAATAAFSQATVNLHTCLLASCKVTTMFKLLIVCLIPASFTADGNPFLLAGQSRGDQQST
jgi:hypothetical protein